MAGMPLTRLVYAAIDHVGRYRADVIEQVSKYAETDLVSYRAEEPVKLQELQNNAWQPLVDWMEKRFGVKLAVTEGVIPVEQDPAHMAVIREVIEGIDDFRLAAVQAITTASGSCAIGLALWDDAIEPEMAWQRRADRRRLPDRHVGRRSQCRRHARGPQADPDGGRRDPSRAQ